MFCVKLILTISINQIKNYNMKVKNLLAAAALCLVSGTASAQVNSYGSLYLQYNPTFMSNLDTYGYDNNYVHGFTLGYFRSIGIGGDNVPLFLEVGGNFNYGLKTEKLNSVRYTLHTLALNIPVNFGYSIRLGDNLALNPYVGLRMRFNLLGVETCNVNGIDNTNFFSKDDLYADYTWNRFQIGGSVGVKMIISEAFFVEAGYTIDFNRLAKTITKYNADVNVNTSSVNLGIGFVF